MGEAREVMDRQTDASWSGDRAGVAACYADDAVLTAPDAGELTGKDAIVEWVFSLDEAFPDGGYESLAKYEDGDTAIDEGFLTGTNTGPLRLPTGQEIPPTGRSIRVRVCDVARVRGGLIRTHRFYFDNEEFARQLGLSEDQTGVGAPD